MEHAHTHEPKPKYFRQAKAKLCGSQNGSKGTRDHKEERRNLFRAGKQSTPDVGEARLPGNVERKELIVPERLLLGEDAGYNQIKHRPATQQPKALSLETVECLV
jgi:hypothetical protein